MLKYIKKKKRDVKYQLLIWKHLLPTPPPLLPYHPSLSNALPLLIWIYLFICKTFTEQERYNGEGQTTERRSNRPFHGFFNLFHDSKEKSVVERRP